MLLILKQIGGGGGVGQDNDIHNANIPLPSLFTEKLVLLRVEVDGNA